MPGGTFWTNVNEAYGGGRTSLVVAPTSNAQVKSAAGRLARLLVASGTGALKVYDAVGPTISAYEATVLADAPVLYYPLDEASGTTANDISGNAHNGTYHGTETFGQAGIILTDPDTSTKFNGSTGYVAASTTGLVSSAFTIEAWINVAAVNYTAQIAGFGPSSTAAKITVVNGGIIATFNTTATTASSAVSTAVWNHVAATWDGTTLTSYLNGASVHTATPTPATLTISTCNIAADTQGSPANFFPDTMGHVAFYATNLSGARILAHYNAAQQPGSGSLLWSKASSTVGDINILDCPVGTGIYVVVGSSTQVTAIYS